MDRRTTIGLILVVLVLAGAGWWAFAGLSNETNGAEVKGAESFASSASDAASTGKQETASDAATSDSAAARQSAATPADPAAAVQPIAISDVVTPPAASSTGDSSASGPSPAATPAPAQRPSPPKRGVADVLEGVDYSIPGERERVVAELKAIEEADRTAAVARAQELGIPVRRELPDGRVQEVAGVDERGQLLYRITHNVNAAISTAANLVQAAPYSLTGTNILAGVWDGGSVRATHQEFGGRVTVRDGSGSIDHATHVGGTIAARGASANAKGMATAARIDSYDWNSDITEMNAAGAATATETNKMLVSNHSYGFISGWNYVNGGSPYRVWDWYGNGTDAAGYEQDFGRYNTNTRSTDLTAVAVPFMTIFWSAGNERNNNPANGQSVALAPNSSTVVSYSSSSHPGGDGTYRNGYQNIGFNSVAKNIVTIGAVNDAVSSGQRSTNNATMSSFSSWGPTDDGRIKPDLVANGVDLLSSGNGSDTTYYTTSGTSMSSPNAAGSAVLVAQEYVQLFGQAMRSSTMRGLLIHTADDIGTAGPDYVNGWGLINTKAAVDLVRDHASNPSKVRLTEGLITTNNQTITHSFTWDGVSPIKATLAWTDPAGAVITSVDSRTRNLVNNLDLRVVGPDGATNRPYVMPFVDNWTTNAMSLPATTGINNTDNVEQVYLATPAAAGTYQAVVTYQGTLSGNQQHYSLLISGSALTFQEEPATISPTSALAAPGVVVTIGGRPGFRDTPDDYTAWTNGSTGGNGFGAWSLTASGNAGHFLATNETNLTVGSAKGFGLYASGGGVATATRNFNNAMEAGDTFMLKFDNNWIDNGGQVGFSLTDSSGTSRLRFYFVGGEQFYRVSDSITGRQTGIPYRDSGLTVYVTLDQNGGYTLVAGGSSFSGTLGGGGAISRLVVQNNNAGPETARNLYIGEMTMTGDPLGASTDVRMVRAGRGDIVAGSVQPVSGQLQATFDLTGAAAGLWTVVATNPDGSTLRFADGFLVKSIIWSDDLDASVAGWASFASLGSNAWSASTVQSHSPSTSYFAPAPSTKTTTRLTSPSIAIPEGAADLELSFWHSYNLELAKDGGRLEISPDNGVTWFDVEAVDSGAAFLSNGYTTTITANTPSNRTSEFVNQRTWSGNSGGFIKTVVSLADASKFAGKTIRLRWILATNGENASAGWHVDSFAVGGALPAGGGGEPAEATVTLGGLSVVYDGTPKAVSVTTSPPNLAVSVTYNGSATVPVNAGSYTVVATVTDPAYTGSATGTLVINKASAEVTLGNLSATYDGTAKTASVTTSPPGLATSVTYDGSATAPVNAGSYAVAATVTDPNYTGSASGTLVIARAAQTIAFGALPAKTFGDSPFAAGGTASSGLTVSYASSNTNVATVSGGAISVAGAGTANITATQAGNSNHEAAAPVVQTLTVTAANASVTLGNLSQIYDGSAKTATVTTDPPGLAVSVTYDGSTTPPSLGGSYAVVATVTEPNYSGTASGTLVIARAAQTITFGALPAKTFGDAPFAAGAMASSGLAVAYTSSNTNVATVSGGSITIVGAGSTMITASQPGDANYEAAAPAEQVLTVAKAAAAVTLGNLSQTFDGEPKLVTVTTDPAGLTVDVTYDGESTPPSETGSYAVVATINDDNYMGSASGTLVIDDELPTFERWISRFEGLSDVTPQGDPDGDGLSNAEEYFMALDPTLKDAAGAVVQGVGSEQVYLDYRRSKEVRGITGAVLWSTHPDVSAGWSSEQVTDVMLQDHGTWELRRASVPWLTEGEHIFLRLDLTME